MKRLILTRHQKSSWDNVHDSDHNRTLNDRGQQGCILIGNWLLEQKFIPDQVLASTAVRCVETWQGIASTINSNAPVNYESGLYHASAELILSHLKKATGDTVFLTAHNPGIGEFADRVCATRPEHDRFFGYPSGATTLVEFDVDDWADINFGMGNCRGFTIPSELQ
jgi:phosphohistidine phosphatase